jgi:hypothetical protein
MYSHYWYRKEMLPQVIFAKAVEDCRKVCKAIGIPLSGWDGSGTPAFTDKGIRFNGRGLINSHETFFVPRTFVPRHRQVDEKDRHFAFCKTAGKPYDLAVCCCLIILNTHFGTEVFRVASDGDEAAWQPAKYACQQFLGYGSDWRLRQVEAEEETVA